MRLARVGNLELSLIINNHNAREVRIGPLHDPVTWYKIIYTGEQIAQRDFQNNAPAFVLEVPLCNLLTSIYNFVPCDRVVQRAYWNVKCSYWHKRGMD